MINVAVVGVGSMGKNHARVYKKLNGVNLVAVCDIDKKNVKKIARLYKCNFYFDYKELIKHEKLDAVSVAVPTSNHYKISVDFINRGIPLLVEKPLASNSKDAKKLAKKAKEKDVILAVGHIERFNPAVIKLNDLIKKGEFGDIMSIMVRRVGIFPPRVKGVNVVIDLAVHDLDIVTSILEKPPKSVYAKGGSSFSKTQEDRADIFLDYGNFGCFVQVNWVTPIKIRKLSITGEKGYAELNYVTQNLELFKSIRKQKKYGGFKEFVEEYGKPRQKKIELKKKEPLRLELENFIESVRNSKKPLVGGNDGIKALLLAEAALKSIRKNKVVYI